MNERIKQLAEEADLYARSDNSSMVFENYQKRHNEKFAELIVRECLMLAQSYPSQIADYAAGIDSVRESIKEHFGVEE